jgi:hypothetical protein
LFTPTTKKKKNQPSSSSSSTMECGLVGEYSELCKQEEEDAAELFMVISHATY